jgi:glycosyltransferase involved in cell wall biosynthesis
MSPAPAAAPRVSVIVPVHNGARYLAAALDSILAQTRTPEEIIVIDDASTDATASILDGYGDRLRRLRNARAGGPGRARNLGLRAASGDLAAFLDADDLWRPAKLERQLAFAAAHADFGVLATDVEGFDDAGRVLSPSLGDAHRIPQGWVLPELLRRNWVATSSALAPRARLLAAGGFDEQPCRLGEDWLLWMRVAAAHPVYLLPEVLTRRRVRPDSLGHGDTEATFHDLLRHLERLQGELEYLRQRPELTRQAAYAICLHRGVQDFHHLQPQRARAKLALARRYGPGWKPRLWTGATYLPVPWVAAAKRVWAELRRDGGEPGPAPG